MTTNPTPTQQETLEPLTDREFEQMEQWAGAGIADPQPYSDLMKLAVKTDAFLQRAIQEIRRTRRAAVAGPQGDAKFTPPAEDALHIAICQAVQEHHGPTANAILREALNDYKPTQLTRTELIRVQQRGGSGDVTAVMVSPAATSSPTPAESVSRVADMAEPKSEAERICVHCLRQVESSEYGPPINDIVWSHVHNGVVWCDWPTTPEKAREIYVAPAERTRVEGEQEFGGSFIAAINAIKAISEDRRATALAMLDNYFAAAPADNDAESLRRVELPSPAQQALQIVTAWRAVVGGDDLLIHYIKQAIEENRTTTKGDR